MIQEIYTRPTVDIKYIPKIDSVFEIEQILIRIRQILGTKRGEVLGDFGFGLDLHEYLFQMNFNEEQIRTGLEDQIDKYVNIYTNKYKITVDVEYGHHHNDVSDYCIINIYINNIKVMGLLVQ